MKCFMTSKKLTSKEIIFIHDLIEEKFNLPKGHIKIGDLETIITKSEGMPFSQENFSLFQQAAILFEGIIRIHIFTDGNKRTALETTRQFLNRNNHVLIVPLSGTNFIYNIAMNETLDTTKILSEISNWLEPRSPKINEWYKIYGLIIYLKLPIFLVKFFSKIKLNRLSKWILHKYIINEEPNVTEFMLSIYEKQFNLFELSEKEHKKQH